MTLQQTTNLAITNEILFVIPKNVIQPSDEFSLPAL